MTTAVQADRIAILEAERDLWRNRAIEQARRADAIAEVILDACEDLGRAEDGDDGLDGCENCDAYGWDFAGSDLGDNGMGGGWATWCPEHSTTGQGIIAVPRTKHDHDDSIEHCARCQTELPAKDTPEFVLTTWTTEDREQVICSDCVTPAEKRAVIEAFGDA